MEICQTNNEVNKLKELVKKSNLVGGDLIEIGIFQGGTSNIIENNKLTEKKLYLVDTFEGLMDVDQTNDNTSESNLKNTDFKYVDINHLVNYFNGKNVEVIKSYFPKDLPDGFQNLKFSFIHLDVDTYLSTLNSLNFLYEMINPGGIIVIHDYINNSAPGVKIAVDEFLTGKKEKINEINDSQCVIIKL